MASVSFTVLILILLTLEEVDVTVWSLQPAIEKK